MFDAVVNHISSGSEWFQEYLKGNDDFADFFIEVDKDTDLSGVTRPRTTPLLTRFETPGGEKYVWTTFSQDQIDLNYQNEKVLLKIIEVLLFYVSKGAAFIRLDAIGYLWKRPGTSCIHLEETHKVVQLFRDILDIVAPEVLLITETNVPHKDNISYFGDGYNEAQMVYQFPLAPLVLYAFSSGSAKYLSQWAETLEQVSDRTAFFNFLASHDGIGVMPAKGILSDHEIDQLVDMVKARGGYVSYKTNSDGTQSPYELNITYYDAICDPDEDEETQVKKFLASQSVMLSMMGVPGIYFHSLLGSRNYIDGVKETGRYRTINREKLQRHVIEDELNSPDSRRFKIFSAFCSLINKRTGEKAFHPNAGQKVMHFDDAVFSILRTAMDNTEKILALINVSGNIRNISIDIRELDSKGLDRVYDIISETSFEIKNNILNIDVEPYQVMWLKF